MRRMNVIEAGNIRQTGFVWYSNHTAYTCVEVYDQLVSKNIHSNDKTIGTFILPTGATSKMW